MHSLRNMFSSMLLYSRHSMGQWVQIAVLANPAVESSGSQTCHASVSRRACYAAECWV